MCCELLEFVITKYSETIFLLICGLGNKIFV